MTSPDFPLLDVFTTLYADIDGMSVSMTDRQTMAIEDSSFTYGEIQPAAFGEVLQQAYQGPGEVFYDLGAGAGKAVIAAALFFDWKKSCGVELLPGLHACSQQVKQTLLAMPQVSDAKKSSVQFVQQDFLKMDFSDADVVYLHATTFSPDLWEKLIEKLKLLKPGTRFVTVTKRLPESHFELVHEQPMMMTWGEASAFIYKISL